MSLDLRVTALTPIHILKTPALSHYPQPHVSSLTAPQFITHSHLVIAPMALQSYHPQLTTHPHIYTGHLSVFRASLLEAGHTQEHIQLLGFQPHMNWIQPPLHLILLVPTAAFLTVTLTYLTFSSYLDF